LPGAGGDFDNRYSQRGVQWAVKQVAKAAGIIITYLPTLLCHAFAGRRHGYHDAQDLWDIKMLRLQWNTCILPNLRVSAFLVHSIRFCTMQSEVADVLRTLKLKVMDSIPGNFVRH
jgi:hypothetical protein